jgi:predicted acetyltransferase
MSLALETAFSTPPARCRRWIRRAGPSNFRVLREGRTVVACLDLIAMGQWFGGRAVPMTGVAGVAVPPEHRARGHGSTLMREAVREMAARGAALSVLYPATQPVYRRAGYGQAGTRLQYTRSAEAFDGRERSPAVRPALPRDLAAAKRVYREVARASSGLLDRTPYMWWRAFGGQDREFRTFVVGDGRPEGYVVLKQEKRTPPGPPYDLVLLDHAFATPAAGRRILSFLAAHRSLAGDVKWCGGPSDPLLSLLAEQTGEPVRPIRWMARVLDVGRALGARGYPPGLSAEVHLAVEDRVLEGNAGRWVLRVSGGRGRAARGGRGRVAVSVEALAPLFTGFRSPLEQRAVGGVEGPDGDLEALGAAFAGPAPWIREMF